MSLHQRRASDTTNRFLFVNKDASTIKVREKDLKLDTAIQSHVQRHMHRKSFAESQIASPILTDEALEDHDNDLGDYLASTPLTIHGPPRLLASSTRSGSSRSPIGHSRRSSQLDHDGEASCGPHSQPYDPESPLELNRSSSTSALEVPRSRSLHIDVRIFTDRSPILRRCSSILLDYWTSVILPERFFFDTRCIPLHHSRHARAIISELHGATVSYARLCALLSSAATHMLTREGSILIPTLGDYERKHLPLTLKTMAIQAIRNDLLQGKVNPNNLYNVQHLFAAADLNELCGDAGLHAKALSDMLECLGGIDAIDAYFAETHLKLHWYGSLSRLQAPPTILAELPCMGDIPLPDPHPAISSEPPVLIADEFHCQQFPPELISIANRLSNVTRCTRSIDSSPIYQPQQIKWASYRHLALGYQLLQLQYTDPILESLRIALVFFTAMIQSSQFDVQVASKSAHRLREVLEPTLVSTSPPAAWERRLKWLIWIAVVGGLTSRKRDDTQWFAEVVAQAVGFYDVTTVENLEGLLEEALYDGVLLRARLRLFWQRYLLSTIR